MPASDIFISYSRSDRPAAMHLAECLEAEGFSVWWDAALHSGQTFDEVIEAELRAAKAVVVLWSPQSVASRWVRAEATLADRLNKLAPVMIEPCERPIIFELTHTTDLTEWPGDRSDPVWRRFMLDLQRAVGRAQPASDKPAKPASAPAFLQGSRREQVEAAAARSSASSGDSNAARRFVRVPAAPASDDTTRATKFKTAEAMLEQLGGNFHCLELESGSAPQRSFVVSPAGLKVGRSAPADVVLPDPSVSRAHCIVELADDRLRVLDLRSTNGTFIDGKKVEGSDFLDVDSVLQIGSFRLTHKVRGRAEI